MRRREFIGLAGGAAAWPLADAQQLKRIGFIAGGARPSAPEAHGFSLGMRALGYVDGKDIVIEWRFAEGKYERFSEFAAELIRLNVDVLVLGTPAAVQPVRQVVPTIPIVMAYSTDPVGAGLVTSLPRPGENITGLANSMEDATPKHLELLATALPNLSRAGILTRIQQPDAFFRAQKREERAQTAGVVLVSAEAQNPRELASAFVTITSERVEGLVIVSDAFFNSRRQGIAELALGSRLATITGQRQYAEAGCLMSYGEDLSDFYRRAATYVDKILKGAKAGDLPIEQPNSNSFLLST